MSQLSQLKQADMVPLPKLLDRRVPPPWKGLHAHIWRSIRLGLAPISVIFAVGMPIFMFVMFGISAAFKATALPHGNVSAAVMLNMALYGAIMQNATMGASVSLERQQGWTRQLRLTPLSAPSYLAAKLIAASFCGLVVVSAVFVAGLLLGAKMEPHVWIIALAVIVCGSLVMAAMGLFVGYLLAGESAYGVIGGGTAILAFLGGLFIPLNQMGAFFGKLAEYTPLYGLQRLASAPLTGSPVEWQWLANVLAWLLIFAVPTAVLISRDTARR